MIEMVKISVIIPTYNRKEYLNGAIQTVLNQTYTDLEIIIIDDGSNNSYADKIVEQYDEPIRLVVHVQNQGLSAARNTGIENSDGEYIAFLDDDDRWHEEKLEQQLASMECTGAGIGTCLVASVSPEGGILRCERNRPEGDLSDEILRENVIGSPSRVVLRRDILSTKRPFDENLRTKQDWDLFIRLCQREAVALVPDHLCIRTIHDSMSSDPEAAKQDNWRIIEKHESLLRSRGEFEAAKAKYHERVGRTFMGAGELVHARKHLRNALRKDWTPKATLLYILTYTSPSLFRFVLTTKRRLENQFTSCDPDIPDEVSL